MRARNELMRLAGGALGGVVATVPMTAVMLGARRNGWLYELPPERITDAALAALSIEPSERTSNVVAGVTHLGFGAACGALYAAISPASRLATGALLGTLFGAGVFAASYQGWVPAVGILPPASRDRPGRPAAMFVAHLVFGAALGSFTAWWRRRRHAAAGRAAPAAG